MASSLIKTRSFLNAGKCGFDLISFMLWKNVLSYKSEQ